MNLFSRSGPSLQCISAQGKHSIASESSKVSELSKCNAKANISPRRCLADEQHLKSGRVTDSETERRSPAEHSSVLRVQPPPGSSPRWGHTSSPGCMGRLDSASRFADGIPWSKLSGTRGLSVPCPILPVYGPDAALHQPGHWGSRSLQAVGGSMHCKGCQHCNQFSDSLFDLHFLHPF